MKRLGEVVACVAGLGCVAGSLWLSYHGSPNWGWFLLVGVLLLAGGMTAETMK